MDDFKSMRDNIVLLSQSSERSQDRIIYILQKQDFIEWVDDTRL